MEWMGYAGSDVGQVREQNEDSFLVENGLGVYMVADGVGGHAAGEVASQMLVSLIAQNAAGLNEALGSYAPGDSLQRRNLLSILPQVLDACSETILRYSQDNPHLHGMATTGVLLVLANEHAFICHAGDSRAYLFRDGRIIQLTEDHTLVTQAVKEGQLSPEEAREHPQRNVISRSLGVTLGLQTDSLLVRLQANDRLLLCSDGLSDMVTDERLLALVEEGQDEALVQALIEAANAMGGRDNITAIVLEPVAPDPDPSEGMDLLASMEFLSGIDLFSKLSDQEHIKLCRALDERTYEDGDAIVTYEAEGDEIFFIVEGQCVVEREGLELALLSENEIFGELAFISRDRRTATVRARGPVRCCVMDRQDLHSLSFEDAVLGNKLLWSFLRVLGARITGLTEEVAALKSEA